MKANVFEYPTTRVRFLSTLKKELADGLSATYPEIPRDVADEVLEAQIDVFREFYPLNLPRKITINAEVLNLLSRPQAEKFHAELMGFISTAESLLTGLIDQNKRMCIEICRMRTEEIINRAGMSPAKP